MNFFPLQQHPQLAAIDNCDKHVIKIPTEIAQLLSTACYVHGLHKPRTMFRPFSPNNPLNLWVAKTYENFLWAAEHGIYLCEEYTYRYGRTHASERIIKSCLKCIDGIFFDSDNLEPFYQAMPDYCKHENPILGYRKYYLYEKSYFATWKKRIIPEWYQAGILLHLIQNKPS